MTLTSRIATLCLTIIAAVGSSTVWAVVCPSTSYELTSQAQVDALGAVGCDAITQNLTIRGSDITNLDALSGITSVGGELSIGYVVNGSYNPALTNLDGLSGITGVVGELFISGNNALTNLGGLSGITGVVGRLWITNNTALTNLNGLSGITGVGSLIIFDNALTNLDGLSGITSGLANGVSISGNNALTNLDGLSGITGVVGGLDISGSNALTNVDGLSGITGVGADLYIYQNNSLTNFDGLSGITSVGGNLGIQLSNLDALSGITSVGGTLSIISGALTNLDGLSGITGVVGGLRIHDNTALTNLNGLSGITSVGRCLTCSGDAGLFGSLDISRNPALTNLDGLSGITSLLGGDYGNTLGINGNDSLADCVGIAQLLGWPYGPPDDSVGGAISVGVPPNASGCNSVEEILASVTVPSQPVITQVSTGNGYAALTFTPSTQTEALFPITGYEAACLGSEVETTTSPALTILDNSDAVKSALTSSGYPAVATPSEVEVDVNISHAQPYHLRIQLTSPQGTILTLWDKSAQTATDIVGTFPTTLTSLDSIDSVASENMNGTWVLSVQDVNAIGGYEGVLNSWGMRIKENAKATGSNSPITISGLANNRDYACTVVPVTKLGVLPTSAAVTATPRPDLPATPVITSVTEDDSGLVVSFILASDGGAPITDYTATCGGISASSNSSPIIVEGLTNGQQYSCTVVATNSVGSSSASAAASGTPEEFTGSGLPIWLLHEATKGNHPLVN
jgi:subtilisin-like proprotein convertase family protein